MCAFSRTAAAQNLALGGGVGLGTTLANKDGLAHPVVAELMARAGFDADVFAVYAMGVVGSGPIAAGGRVEARFPLTSTRVVGLALSVAVPYARRGESRYYEFAPSFGWRMGRVKLAIESAFGLWLNFYTPAFQGNTEKVDAAILVVPRFTIETLVF